MLYRDFLRFREEVVRLLNEKLKRIEPLMTIFKRGYESYKKVLEEDIKRRYVVVEPIMGLIEVLGRVTSGRLDENWTLSTLVLAALENVVNIKLKELRESIGGKFPGRVSRLKEALIKKAKWNEREASDLARRLRGKYEERNVIIHGGYENPATREAALEDLEFLKYVLKKLFKMG